MYNMSNKNDRSDVWAPLGTHPLLKCGQLRHINNNFLVNHIIALIKAFDLRQELVDRTVRLFKPDPTKCPRRFGHV